MVGLALAMPHVAESTSPTPMPRQATFSVAHDRDAPWAQRVTQAARELCGAKAVIVQVNERPAAAPLQPALDGPALAASNTPVTTHLDLPSLVDLPPPTC